MNSEWASRSLGEFARLQRGHDLTASEQRAGSVPVMGSAGPNGTHSEALAKGPGLVIGRSGASIGRVHFSEVDYWPHNTCLYVTDFLGNNPRFAYYFLQTLNLAGYNSGSAQPSLNRNFIYSIRIQVPDRWEQDEIAHLLNSLDDRIALLREANATLEAIAQALFKSWFVDFDPVRAKQQGLAPAGMDEATADLFPASFEESTLGLVPKGWRAGIVADLGVVVCGKTPPTAEPENYGDEVPFITIPDMHAKLVVTAASRSLSRLGADSQRKKYLPPGSICVSCIATPGLVVRVTSESQTNQQINSVVPHPAWGKAFPLFLLRRIGDAVRIGGSGGSVFHNLSKSGFEALGVLLADVKVVERFDELVEPLVEKITANQTQAQTLATLRDTLLPRLISGQLRLPQAGIELAKVTA